MAKCALRNVEHSKVCFMQFNMLSSDTFLSDLIGWRSSTWLALNYFKPLQQHRQLTDRLWNLIVSSSPIVIFIMSNINFAGLSFHLCFQPTRASGKFIPYNNVNFYVMKMYCQNFFPLKCPCLWYTYLLPKWLGWVWATPTLHDHGNDVNRLLVGVIVYV